MNNVRYKSVCNKTVSAGSVTAAATATSVAPVFSSVLRDFNVMDIGNTPVVFGAGGYSPGIDVPGCDSSLCATHGVCTLTPTVTGGITSGVTAGTSSGSAVGPPGGTADLATTCTTDGTTVPLPTSSLSTSTITSG